MDNRSPSEAVDIDWEASFARSLRALRQEAELSLNELARRLPPVDGRGWHPQQVNRIENGERKVGLNEAVVVARFFNRTLHQLMGMADESASSRDDYVRTLERVSRGTARYATDLKRGIQSLDADREAASVVSSWLARQIASGRDEGPMAEAAATTATMLDTMRAAFVQSLHATNEATAAASRSSMFVADWMSFK
ncbi:helix-turn-helix transcriptional regulator [Demequina sp. SYSU T00068]|uniref:helix-turn-helix domain-containing protein n=1 Tax=Demequina lignilytica TaxID=3051663 RepID=UPI0026118528|nr:helix-turn-helix transcriptional regulator [Demequina sp. SYSU T00068]MDN4489241.1 helix-turn-helix transcriptional regulator [Demequina sp. SYSU T00068]